MTSSRKPRYRTGPGVCGHIDPLPRPRGWSEGSVNKFDAVYFDHIVCAKKLCDVFFYNVDHLSMVSFVYLLYFNYNTKL